MLWNWNTVDSCFISSSWQITSDGMFAGTCIAVILLVMVLEALRRSVKEYDRYLVRSHAAAAAAAVGSSSTSALSDTTDADTKDRAATSRQQAAAANCRAGLPPPFRPNVLQQAIRALLHMLQFVVAYFIMLLAMYYNGYLLICIFIGAYLGSFAFQWETLSSTQNPTSAAQEATVCCG